MKRIVSLLLVVLIGWGGANACKKKSRQRPADCLQPLTVIVMDSTQALLDCAEVKAGKAVFKTSFDGRVVLKPEQIAGVKAIAISRKGFEDVTFALDGAPLAIVAMKAKPRKAGEEDEGVVTAYGLGATRSGKKGEILYKTSLAAAPEASADGAVLEEEAVEAMYMVADKSGTAPVGYGGTNNAISAGKLTAGEVNDFVKWYFWPRVIDESHKDFVRQWQVAPRHRYTVQVMNQGGYPIAGRAVSLLDQAGNTLFQAVTDNTGKAELWYQLISTNQCGKHAGLQIRVDDQVREAKDWSEGMNSFVLDEGCEAAEGVDVCFVFDATGSMGDELRYLQAEMKDVISRAKAATGGLKIRTGAVVYRDHGDEYITRISRLTDNIEETKAFIDRQAANGGGDFPEAIPEALMAAMNSAGWDSEARARIAFLILDAPCHQDSATIALLHEQILNAAAIGVRIVPVVCSGLDKSGEILMRSIAMATNGTSFFLTDDSGIGHSHLKPTTDSLKVEHLNDMLVRTIMEFSYMPDCAGQWHEEEIAQLDEQFIPDPFKAEEIADDPTIPHGEGVLYLLDVSGKLIRIYEGSLDEASDMQLAKLHMVLPTGVYFVKAFYGGGWHTKKILVH